MVNLLTALIIQGNETTVSPYQDKKSQKWGYEVSRMERGNQRLLITCSAIYDSREVAQKEGEGFVGSIRKLDLSLQCKELGDLLGDSKEAVQSIIKATNGSRQS